MEAEFSRRALLTAGIGFVASEAFSLDQARSQPATATTSVRMATGLRATAQSIVWIGAEAGVFRRHGLDVSFAKLEAGGPESTAGLVRGDWEFCADRHRSDRRSRP